jgi:surfeit locus 1 family protein
MADPVDKAPAPGPWHPPGLKVRQTAGGEVATDRPRAPQSPLPDAATTTRSPEGPARGFSFRPLPILTVLTALSLAVLLMLGQWQWAKFVEKSGAPPPGSAAALAPMPVLQALQGPARDFQPVTADGLMDGRTVPIYAVSDGVRGARLFSPLVMEAGVIFVDRGFVPETSVRDAPPVLGPVQVRGVLRVAAPANRMTPPNDPASGAWYWPDTKALGVLIDDTQVVQGRYLAMALVDPLKTGRLSPNAWADPKGANQVTADRHLGYALTWWGFAVALIGVYVGFHARAGRLRFGKG